jgi:hypothetical protein
VDSLQLHLFQFCFQYIKRRSLGRIVLPTSLNEILRPIWQPELPQLRSVSLQQNIIIAGPCMPFKRHTTGQNLVTHHAEAVDVCIGPLINICVRAQLARMDFQRKKYCCRAETRGGQLRNLICRRSTSQPPPIQYKP